MVNYITIVRVLEDGKFLLSFPDFDGLTTIADSEEDIQNTATETIKSQLVDLKTNNLDIPEAKKMNDVVSTLNEGEFTIYIPINEKIEVKAATAPLKNVELKKEKIEEPSLNKEEVLNEEKLNIDVPKVETTEFKTTKTNLKNEKNKRKIKTIPEAPKNSGNSNFKAIAGIFGLIGGILSIISTLILPILTVEIPILGDYSIGNFRGLDKVIDFSEGIQSLQNAFGVGGNTNQMANITENLRFLQSVLIFFGILFIALAGMLIYSSLIKNKNILLCSIIANFIFIAIFYIILYIKLPSGEVREFISISFIKILLYVVSLLLAFVSYFIIRSISKNEDEETEEPLEPIFNDGDDKNEKRF